LHLTAIIAPFYFFSWGAVLTAFVLYIVTGMFGITLGYHRLLTHRSFKAPRWVERTLATCGVLALQRGPLEWVATHRMHHAFCDDELDPHNAHKGFWWSHIGWMMKINPNLRDTVKLRKFARDIAADPYLNWLGGDLTQIFLQVLLGLILLALGGWTYVIWGVFVRVVFVYHVTWFVNSATHKFGYRRYGTEDLSTNCWWVGVLAFGEGWHNNHHAYPDVAPAGHSWWEFDLTYLVIRLMKKLGWAYEIKLPIPERTVTPSELAPGSRKAVQAL
jgi:stearoyl-CoA desaturase (delta-9 desaturase)